MNRLPSILIVDDDAFVRDSLVEIFLAEGWRTHAAAGAGEAEAVLEERAVDLVVSDLRMPGGDAFVVLERARARHAWLPVVVITGVGTIPEAVRAMKEGAHDFLTKPVDPEELLLTARRAVEHGRLLREVDELRSALHGLRSPREIVGDSGAMRGLRARIDAVAPTDSPVWISGPSGSGKGLVADLVLQGSSRARRPARWIRGAAGASAQASREGAEHAPLKWSELAGGTLIVDDIDRASEAQQELLLDALQERRDVRLLAIASSALPPATPPAGLRPELYFRLNVFEIAIPPLSEHLEDLPAITGHFLGWALAQQGRAALASKLSLSPASLELLSAYGWPGNVRELRNVLERALIVGGERALKEDVLREILESALSRPAPAAEGPASAQELNLRRNLDAAEKAILLRALAQSEGLKKKAAYLLGIDARNLNYYLRKHALVEEK